ncbi:MAG: FAD-dependent oxidoreductase [Oscillospiraceae bacterium]|jgi:NADPH-dependent 2,4-dienoyl-CoA reductase/sulfur reductase-like enzyme/rhodanese-related sulfurtransferase|nr:FAD-dependent oxidoreductase [Oscillospiraceae bacterium]
MKVLIVGGVAGGASAAARLRRLDEKAEIIIFERGEFISFANCGLPYHIGGVIESRSDLVLQTPQSFKSRFNIDVRTFSLVTGIDTDKKCVSVKDLKSGAVYTESYDSLILSTGAEPVRPPVPGADGDKVFTLRTIPDTLRIKQFIADCAPKSAVIVGGGYIGVEMAENLAFAGLDVAIVERADHLVAPLDYDIAVDLHHYIRSKGVKLVLNNGLAEIKEEGGQLAVMLEHGQLEADFVIMAVGVKPDTALAREAGLALNARGCILVDEACKTSQPDIYAVGDAVEVVDFVSGQKSFVPLAGPANRQGRIAADAICGLKSRYGGTQGSSILKVFDMTVACTGLSEASARKAGIDCDKVFLYAGSHAGYYPGATNMSVKVLFERGSGRLLGAQFAGYDGVDKRCDVMATAIRLGATAYDLTELELCYAPPYSSAKDPVNMAGFAIQNVLDGLVDSFHWHDVDDLPRDGSVTLLDVRTPGETARGMIDGFIAIPLDNLRAQLHELNKDKPIYVHCQSGLRSYIACRILVGNGFKCYNLSGGYRLYNSIKRAREMEIQHG